MISASLLTVLNETREWDVAGGVHQPLQLAAKAYEGVKAKISRLESEVEAGRGEINSLVKQLADQRKGMEAQCARLQEEHKVRPHT